MPIEANSKNSKAIRRVTKYDARMRRDGFVKKHVWVPGERLAEFESIVAGFRAERTGIRTSALRNLVARLRRHERRLRELGLSELSIFGSCARGEETETSDLDVLIGFEDDVRIGLLERVRVRRELAEISGRSVDMARADDLPTDILARVLDERIVVF